MCGESTQSSNLGFSSENVDSKSARPVNIFCTVGPNTAVANLSGGDSRVVCTADQLTEKILLLS